MGTAAPAIGVKSEIGVGSKDEKFEAVALTHMDSIYRSALYMAKDESDAQDLV